MIVKFVSIVNIVCGKGKKMDSIIKLMMMRFVLKLVQLVAMTYIAYGLFRVSADTYVRYVSCDTSSHNCMFFLFEESFNGS